MYTEYVDVLTKILNLKSSVIGVKLISYKKEYEELDIPELNNKRTICGMMNEASFNRNLFKATSDACACIYGSLATGLTRPAEAVTSGRTFFSCKLYSDLSTAKAVYEEMEYLDSSIYGISMGPLNQMEDADLAVFFATALDMMHVVAGYTYHDTTPKNISTTGNQGACADLISKPFTNNDLNISFLCKGARLMINVDDGMLGASIPLGKFKNFVEGLIAVVNPIFNTNQKKELRERLEHSNGLNISVDESWNYSTEIRKYHSYLEEVGEDIIINNNKNNKSITFD